MKRTSPVVLILLVLLGAAVGYGLDHLLTISGQPTFVPSGFLPVVLIILAVVVVVLAWPVRRSMRGGKRVDPFRAIRTATLARASSLLGAMLAGFGAGLGIFLWTRPVSPPVGSIAGMVVLVVCSMVLVAAALLAEQFCTLPKESDDREPDDPAH